LETSRNNWKEVETIGNKLKQLETSGIIGNK
jgi:hypothetical protein